MCLVNDHHHHAVISAVRKTPTLVAVNTVILVVCYTMSRPRRLLYFYSYLQRRERAVGPLTCFDNETLTASLLKQASNLDKTGKSVNTVKFKRLK